MLNKDPDQRPSAADVLADPWFDEMINSKQSNNFKDMKLALTNLKNFRVFSSHLC
jgi:hypothetical protein